MAIFAFMANCFLDISDTHGTFLAHSTIQIESSSAPSVYLEHYYYSDSDLGVHGWTAWASISATIPSDVPLEKLLNFSDLSFLCEIFISLYVEGRESFMINIKHLGVDSWSSRYF